MKTIQSLLLGSTLFLGFTLSNAEIIKTSNLQALQKAVQNSDADTLWVFDIDEVLMVGKDRVLQGGARRNPFLEKHYGKEYKEVEYLSGYIWSQCGVELVDPAMPALISAAAKTDAKVICLTAGWAGHVGDQKCFEETRIQRLKELGFDFEAAFPLERLVLKNISIADRNPLFYKGVLFTCHHTKSAVLEEFLKHVDHQPKKIIFVDDSEKNVKDIHQWCEAKGIECIVIHYTAVEEKNSLYDAAVGQFQFDYLIKNNKWLSDTEAKKLMNK